jgi:hypothetical protein
VQVLAQAVEVSGRDAAIVGVASASRPTVWTRTSASRAPDTSRAASRSVAFSRR